MTCTRVRTLLVLAAGLAAAAAPASAAAATRISTDPYTNAKSQHATEVEPDSFASGQTVVSAFQVGRFTDGGASNAGFAVSANAGTNWTQGFLPGTTVFATPAGPYDRVSDPSVAYDATHDSWLIATLALRGKRSPKGAAVLVNRSDTPTTGGPAWTTNPVVVSAASRGADYDKDWIACDNGSSVTSHPGRCYVTWDDYGHGNRMKFSYSSDGGATWSAPANTADNATGLGGQPVVQPDGTVIVPFGSAFGDAIKVTRSTDGGATWSAASTISQTTGHPPAGGLRSGEGLPSAEIDSTGRVYVAWEDCRFSSGCSKNDIVFTRSSDGITWDSVKGVPDTVSGHSTADHFIPGLGVDPAGTGVLALTYYYYPAAACGSACELSVGYTTSTDGGANWTTPSDLASGIALNWIAATSQGRMVGDYISTSFAGATVVPAFVAAAAPSSQAFDEFAASTTGLTATAGGDPAIASANAVITPSGSHAIPGAGPDHASGNSPLTHR